MRKPRAGPMISPVLRRISRRSNRRRAGDGDRIVGLDSSACAAGSDAGVVPAGNGHANGEAAPAASSSHDEGEFDLTRHDRASLNPEGPPWSPNSEGLRRMTWEQRNWRRPEPWTKA